MPPTFGQLSAELGGIPPARLSDEQELAGLLLAAANAAGLAPTAAPLVRLGPSEVSGVLLCRGGHVLLHGVPEAGTGFVDLAGRGAPPLQRGLDVVVRRLGAHPVRGERRPHGSPHTAAADDE